MGKLQRPYLFEPEIKRLMERAISLAKKSKDVPVGAIVSDCEGRVVSEAFNDRSSPFLHAECIALREAERKTGMRDFRDFTLISTLEPCPMCAGAAIACKVGRIAFGCWDGEMGACGSVWDIPREGKGWKAEVVAGFEREKCSRLLRAYFSEMR